MALKQLGPSRVALLGEYLFQQLQNMCCGRLSVAVYRFKRESFGLLHSPTAIVRLQLAVALTFRNYTLIHNSKKISVEFVSETVLVDKCEEL